MSLSTEEIELADSLVKKLSSYELRNVELEKYYDAKQVLRDFNISIPPTLKNVESVVGWPGTVVSVLEERLDLEGFLAPASLGLDDIYRNNELGLESSLGHLDALIYGTGFIIVGKGDSGEPDPLITIESPRSMTGNYDLRLRRLTSALRIDRDKVGRPRFATLYLPNVTISMEWQGGTPFEIDRDEHNLGRVPVVYLANNPRSGDPYGKTEITRAIRYYTDAAVRTVLGSEVAREFYSAPQRYILGADPDYFMDSDGNPLNPWTVYQGRVLGVPLNEDGGMPQVGQFNGNSTLPYFEQIKALAQMVAAESAIPASYLGFQTDNPASADAIRQMESRLVKRAERRQGQFGRAWVEVAKLALLIRDGSIPAEANTISPIWRDASTPTRAAAADETMKLIQTGVLLPDSEITYNRIGLSDSDKRVLTEEKRRYNATSLVGQLADAARAAQNIQVNSAVDDSATNLTGA
jgi:hypothetical protein|tara:strand:+ start:2489 stop:3886 length:1398 start_codon:yes stop_codon:yes gene_type:complete